MKAVLAAPVQCCDSCSSPDSGLAEPHDDPHDLVPDDLDERLIARGGVRDGRGQGLCRTPSALICLRHHGRTHDPYARRLQF
jgi:hypothetical protein